MVQIISGKKGKGKTKYLLDSVNGAINWGLIGFFKFDLVSWLFGSMSLLTRIIYAIVGLGGLYLLSFYGRIRDFSQE